MFRSPGFFVLIYYFQTKEVIVPAAGGTGSLNLSAAKSDSTAGIIVKTEPDVKPIKESWSPEEPQPQTFEPNGIRPRKPCNCTKSMCLKLLVFKQLVLSIKLLVFNQRYFCYL